MLCGVCGATHRTWYDRTRRRVRDFSSGGLRVYLDVEVRCVHCRRCKAVKRERLEFLSDNPFYTERFAWYVGRRCRSSTIKDIAEELHLHWHTVKELEKQYMRQQLKRASQPRPKVIGIDQISVRKRHVYRIVVSDLEKHRPIWFGGQDRSEQSVDEFYRFLGEKKARKVPLAVPSRRLYSSSGYDHEALSVRAMDTSICPSNTIRLRPTSLPSMFSSCSSNLRQLD